MLQNTVSAHFISQVQHCDICQRVKRKFDHPSEPLHPLPVPSKVWSQIGVDLVGPLQVTSSGNQYIVVAVDYFSKWPEAKAIPSKEAIHVADFLNSLFLRHGFPEVLISDQGREFCNAICNELLTKTGVKHRITSAYHPQTNGLTERFNQTLKNGICQMTNCTDEDWDSTIEAILFSYRTAVHASTKFTPFFLFNNRDPRMPLDVQLHAHHVSDSTAETTMHCLTDEEMQHDVELLVNLKHQYTAAAKRNIVKAQERQKAYYDKRHNTYSLSLDLNDQVLLKNSEHDSRKGGKLDVKWTGPYWVSERLPKGCFKLKNGNGAVLKQIFHASRLKPYYPPQSYEPCGTGTSDECKDTVCSDLNMIVLHTHGVSSVY